MMCKDFYRDWIDLYDVMVDWPARLAREGPMLLDLIGGGKRVLDVACGTGRHLAWLAQAGLAVVGADVSSEMLAKARANLPAGRDAPLVRWSMSEPPPAELAGHAPFDALLCLGNSFPHVVEPAAVERTLAGFRSLLGPGGRLVLGVKALAVLADAKRPFLPLVKRPAGDGEALFVRFYDFLGGEPASADFHLVIIGAGPPGEAHHVVTRLRSWRPVELGEAVRRAGFDEVAVARDLVGQPWRPGDGEDVFVIASVKR